MGMARANGRVMSAVMCLLMAAPATYAQGTPQNDNNNSGSTYLAQHFSFDALNSDVQAAVTRANLAPVPFKQIVLHTRETVTSSEHAQQPATYTSAMTLEDAGHGLVRRVEAVQDNDGNTVATRLELTYRGYFSLLTQGISPHDNKLPPVQGARKVLRLDTGTSGHFAFVYLYGGTGEQAFADPGQFLCDAGKRYSASQLNPAIQGSAVELDCRAIDTNGIETDKVTLAYLEHYAVAVTLRTHNDQRSIDSTILDFSSH